MQEIEPRTAPARPAASTPTSDGEGSLAESELTARGIQRISVDQFEVGGYRYTSLKDALAQSNRSEAGQGRSR